jgi:hypothetical protein
VRIRFENIWYLSRPAYGAASWGIGFLICLYVVASKRSRNSLVYFTGTFDCRGLVHYGFITEGKTGKKECTLTFFVALGMQSERKAPEN